MWLWQHKNIHKRHLLWAKLFGICLFFHLIVLFWVFCVYRENSYTVSISLNKKLDYSAPILFRPYYAPSCAKSSGGATKGKPAATVKPTPKKPVPAAKAAPEKAPTVMAAIKPKPTEIKPVPTPKIVPPVTTKKPEAKEALEDLSFKPSFAEASEARRVFTAEQSRSIRTSAEEKTVPKIEAPKPTPTPVETKKEVTQTISPKESFDTPPVAALPPSPRLRSAGTASGEGKEVVPVIPENAYVSDNYREVEALRRHAQLQNEIIKCWKPPFGISPAGACDISFSVSTTGAVQDVVITKSSGALMYDISARQALYAMAMPKWTYGKQLIINFKQ